MSDWKPAYSKWRHGGWYVTNVHYPSGACGCVSNNFDDKKWRIVTDPSRTTFPSRDAAARAERAAVALGRHTEVDVKALLLAGLGGDEVAQKALGDRLREAGDEAAAEKWLQLHGKWAVVSSVGDDVEGGG